MERQGFKGNYGKKEEKKDSIWKGGELSARNMSELFGEMTCGKEKKFT